MAKNQKLELTWIGKEKRPKLEPRILLEDPAKSYHAKHRVASDDFFDNRLIFGDKPLARKAGLAALLTSFGSDLFKYFAVNQRVAAT